ncbi:MAG: hypothetical protein ACYC1Q_14120 [Bacteroidia bacterium]
MAASGIQVNADECRVAEEKVKVHAKSLLLKTSLLNFGLSSLFLVSLTCSSCSKGEVKKEEASLKLRIPDSNGDLLSGATG